MSCKDIIPQISIDGITINQVSGKGTPLKPGYIDFSKKTDEQFRFSMSHTNIVEAPDFLGFSLNDIKEATVGSPSLYSVKVLFTNDPDKYQLIQEVINLSKQVAFYLYSDDSGEQGTYSQNPTAQEIKGFAKNTPKDAPQAAKDAVENLNKCVFKLAGISQASGIPLFLGSFSAPLSQSDIASLQQIAEEQKNKVVAAIEPVLTLKDKVIQALNDNFYNGLDAINDGIFSFNHELNLDQDNPKLSGEPLTLKLESNQEMFFWFGDTQLKNLYMALSPNFEYRENAKLIFTIRDFLSLPLVLDYAPQNISENKQVQVNLLKESQGLDYFTKFIEGAFLSQILKNFGTKGYQTFIDNIKPESFLSQPFVSVDYKKTVNGVFFLDQKKLAKNLTSYEAILEQPDLYKDVLKSVRVKKQYANGTQKELNAPSSFEGMEFQGGIIRGYHFVDEYEVLDFDYIIEVDAKNPLEAFLQYAFPKLIEYQELLQKLIKTFSKKPDTGVIQPVIIFNPVSGYFTDDFYASQAYSLSNLVYKLLRESLFGLFNYLLPGDPVSLPPVELNSLSQLTRLDEQYNKIITTLQQLANTEGINIETQSSTNQKNQAKKNTPPYKTLTQKYNKPYKGTDARVYYDYLFTQEPANDGFIISPQDILNRIATEESVLASFGVQDAITTFADDEMLSITPVSIKIDDTSINLIEDQEKIEETTTKVLLSAELEIKKPTLRFEEEENVFATLLATDGVEIVEKTNKILVEVKEQDNFIPNDFLAAISPKSGQKLSQSQAAGNIFLSFLKQQAMNELGQQTAKALYLDEADINPAEVLLAAILKSAPVTKTIPAPDKVHGEIAKALGIDGYKQNPSTYITRLMNAYQLEYLTGFDSKMSPIFAPLTKGFLNNFPEDFSVVIRLVLKAGIPVSSDYTILHSYFILNKTTIPLIGSKIFEFLPDISVLKNINLAALIKKPAPVITATPTIIETSVGTPISGLSQQIAAQVGLPADLVVPPPAQVAPQITSQIVPQVSVPGVASQIALGPTQIFSSQQAPQGLAPVAPAAQPALGVTQTITPAGASSSKTLLDSGKSFGKAGGGLF